LDSEGRARDGYQPLSNFMFLESLGLRGLEYPCQKGFFTLKYIVVNSEFVPFWA
jgi:hypothetical protein